MDTWTLDQVRRIVDALRIHLEAMPSGNGWAVKQVSGELRHWLDLERKLTGRPAAGADSQPGQPGPGQAVLTTRPAATVTNRQLHKG